MYVAEYLYSSLLKLSVFSLVLAEISDGVIEVSPSDIFPIKLKISFFAI